jgi:hypothetical protein
VLRAGAALVSRRAASAPAGAGVAEDGERAALKQIWYALLSAAMRERFLAIMDAQPSGSAAAEELRALPQEERIIAQALAASGAASEQGTAPAVKAVLKALTGQIAGGIQAGIQNGAFPASAEGSSAGEDAAAAVQEAAGEEPVAGASCISHAAAEVHDSSAAANAQDGEAALGDSTEHKREGPAVAAEAGAEAGRQEVPLARAEPAESAAEQPGGQGVSPEAPHRDEQPEEAGHAASLPQLLSEAELVRSAEFQQEAEAAAAPEERREADGAAAAAALARPSAPRDQARLEDAPARLRSLQRETQRRARQGQQRQQEAEPALAEQPEQHRQQRQAQRQRRRQDGAGVQQRRGGSQWTVLDGTGLEAEGAAEPALPLALPQHAEARQLPQERALPEQDAGELAEPDAVTRPLPARMRFTRIGPGSQILGCARIQVPVALLCPSPPFTCSVMTSTAPIPRKRARSAVS